MTKSKQGTSLPDANNRSTTYLRIEFNPERVALVFGFFEIEVRTCMTASHTSSLACTLLRLNYKLKDQLILVLELFLLISVRFRYPSRLPRFQTENFCTVNRFTLVSILRGLYFLPITQLSSGADSKPIDNVTNCKQ